MSEPLLQHSKPTFPLGLRVYMLGLRVYLFAAFVIAPFAGIGAQIGKHLGGTVGYWVGWYFVAIVLAALAGWLFGRLFRSHPLYWVFGAWAQLLFAHLMMFAWGGDALASGYVQWVVIGAGMMVGTFLGLAAAYPLVKRSESKVPNEPGAPPEPGCI